LATLHAFSRAVGDQTSAERCRQNAAALIGTATNADGYASVETNDSGDLRFQLSDTKKQKRVADFCVDGPKSTITATAIRSGETIYCEDLTTDSRFAGDPLLEYGVGGAVVIPLQHQRDNFGAIAVYRRQRWRLDKSQRQFCETAAQLASLSVANCEAKVDLRTERSRADHLLREDAAPLFDIDADGIVLQMSAAAGVWCKNQSASLASQPFWARFAVPIDVPLLRQLFQQVSQRLAVASVEAWFSPEKDVLQLVRWTIDELPPRRGHQRQFLLRANIQRQTSDSSRNTNQQSSRKRPGNSRANGRDEREHPRRPYPYTQRIASMTSDRLPSLPEFSPTQFRDISTFGASFILHEQPASRNLVLELGQPPNFMYVLAQIRHTDCIRDENGTRFLVGCEFNGRVAVEDFGGPDRRGSRQTC
jgi:hypothetical protein